MTRRAAESWTVLSLLDVREPIFSRDTNWGDLVVTIVKEGEAGRKVVDLWPDSLDRQVAAQR